MTDPLSDPFNPGATPPPDYEPGRGDPDPSGPIGPDVGDPTPVEVPESPTMTGGAAL
jgi:hypothetical protein